MRPSTLSRQIAYVTALCFAWSFVLASTASAATYHEPVPPGRTRSLSAAEMKRIVGASAILGGDPDTGGNTTANVGASPGGAYPWEGSVGDVKTDNGNKLTAVHIVGFTSLGGMPLSVSLYHNSLADAGNTNQTQSNAIAPKWSSSYEVALVQNSSTHNVTVYWGDGRSYTFTHNVDGSFTAPAGVYDTLTPDSSDSSFNITTKSQIRYHFGFWGAAHYLITVSDENGNTIHINRNSSARILSVYDDLNRTVTFHYTNSTLTSLVDPLGRTWTIGYDSSSRPQTITFPTVSGHSYTMQFGYDSHSNINLITDKRGNPSIYYYNADSTIQYEQSAAGNRTSFAYGASGIVTITAPNGVQTKHYYDTYGHLIKVEDALQYTTQYSNFDADNHALTVTDARGYNHTFTYDGNGNLLSATAPPTLENSGGNKVTFTYNSHNKPTLIKTQQGRQVALTYDGSDNLIKVQNKNSGGTVVATTTFTINPGDHGLVTAKTDANNHVTTYGYDNFGFVNSITTPLGHQTQWTHNVLGFTLTRTDAKNVMTTYTLDNWNRTTAITYSSDATPGNDGQKTYSYDANDNLVAFANAAGSSTRTYDADNRMTEEDYQGTQQVRHVYDLTGQAGLLSATYDVDNIQTTYGYSGRNQLATVTSYGNTTNYSYDAAGNELAINDPYGNYATKVWDAAGRLQSIVNKAPDGTYLSGYAYLYTQDSEKSKVTETGYTNTAYAVENWTYDDIGHLKTDVRTGTSPFNASYTVDGVSNRTAQTVNGTSSTLTYDADDEIISTSLSNNLYQYDADGSQTGKRVNSAWVYPTYTNEGQVANMYAYGDTGAPTVQYTYDALGRQVVRNERRGTVTTYQYDGDNILTERQGATTSSRYLFGTNRLFKYDPNGEAPQLDGLGSMRQGLGASSGQFTGKFDFDAFGNSLNGTSGAKSVYQWGAQSGYRTDIAGGDGGYVKVGCRYYDPLVGRFSSRDTDVSQPAYVYCGGDPVNNTDPSGHSWLSSAFGAITKVFKSVVNSVINAVSGVAKAVVSFAEEDLHDLAIDKVFTAIFYAAVVALAPVFIAALGLTAGAELATFIASGVVSGFVTGELDGRNGLGLALYGIETGTIFFTTGGKFLPTPYPAWDPTHYW